MHRLRVATFILGYPAVEEQQGMHRCDRCRPVSTIAAQFGSRLNVDDLPVIA